MLTLEALDIRQDEFCLMADFRVEAGALVAIVGPSGAGKSTLLSVISGFFAPVSGRVLWDGRDITDAPPADRPLSIVFQDNNLFPHLTAFENVALGVQPSLRLSSTDAVRVDRALERVGLKGMEHRKPAALSGGQQSRVTLARVLVRHRPLILLDEPFAALGPALRDEMLDLVAELATSESATVLMVTHQPTDALRIADQTVVVANGVAEGPVPTKALFEDPPQVLRDYLG
jgi:thiamine transport system ATP-binding protein